MEKQETFDVWRYHNVQLFIKLQRKLALAKEFQLLYKTKIYTSYLYLQPVIYKKFQPSKLIRNYSISIIIWTLLIKNLVISIFTKIFARPDDNEYAIFYKLKH